jgi:hypothetical protein
MFARTLLVVFSCAAFFSSSALVSSGALAQCGSPRYQPRIELARQIVPIIDMPRESPESGVTSLNELARSATNHVDSRYQSCESHRIQNQQWAMKQEAARNNAARSAAPAKQWTDEERASSKYQAAHGLWQAGRTDAARRWLEVVVREYSKTPTADRARAVLAKL